MPEVLAATLIIVFTAIGFGANLLLVCAPRREKSHSKWSELDSDGSAADDVFADFYYSKLDES